MTTAIISNGSKWAGDSPDTIDDLLAVLGTHALDRTFEPEQFGNFIFQHDKQPGITCFFGNFAELSHVFNIDTDDQNVIDLLTAAIRANQQRPDYLSQPTYDERAAVAAAREHEKSAARQAERERQARVTLGMEAAS